MTTHSMSDEIFLSPSSYPFNVSDAVVEAVVRLKIRVAPVPFWINVPFGARISQEVVCFSRVNADWASRERRRNQKQRGRKYIQYKQLIQKHYVKKKKKRI